MEAVAGLSLAANILQVVDFTANVLSIGRQIHQAGSTVQNTELRVVVKDFTALNDRLKTWSRPNPAALGPLAEDSQALENLANESGNIAKELIALLESLQGQAGASKHRNISQAVRTVWSADKINGLKNRLQTVRDELQYRILVSIRQDQIQGIDEASRRILEEVLGSNKSLAAQTNKISKHQNIEGQMASQRHGEVLNAISRRHITTVAIEDVTETIKSELFFIRKDDRFEDIAIAHKQTFQWTLEDRAKPTASWPSLLKWLREDGGVYWIAGKAGSGKSTLMKYLYQDPRMVEALNIWAGDKRLIVLDFYFWKSGASIQRSQEGLFRSLLWQILEQDPTFGSLLFPEQYLRGARWDEFPTFHQLRRAFGRLTEQRHDAVKIAMVIDGLDEFDTHRFSMSELAEMFLAATKHGSIKVLLSSRPLTPFEDCFIDQPKLRLHQITHNDITMYVHDRLTNHHRVASLPPSSNKEIEILTRDIVVSASGVFLWVKLVIESLIEMLQNGDTVQDLRNQLHILPPDLEDLFQYMLGTIPMRYKSHASRIFQLLQYQKRWHGRLSNGFTLTAPMLLKAELSDADVLRAKLSPLSPSKLERCYEDANRQIKSRSAGLLELQVRHHTPTSRKEPPNSAANMFRRIWTESEVVYLHRSVADYLRKEEIWKSILSQNMDKSFNASQVWLRSILGVIKNTPLDVSIWASGNHELVTLWNVIESALKASKKMECTLGTAPVALLDELDRNLSVHFDSRRKNLSSHPAYLELKKTWYATRPLAVSLDDDNFLTLATMQGLDVYVAEKIKGEGITKTGRPLLQYAFVNSSAFSEFLWPEVVRTILRGGANPNDIFDGYSAWQLAIGPRERDPCRLMKILEYLVLHGADPNAPCPPLNKDRLDTPRHSPLYVLQDFFENTSTSSVGELTLDESNVRFHIRRRLRDIRDYIDPDEVESKVEDAMAQLNKDWLSLKNLLISKGAKEITWVWEGDHWKKIEKKESRLKKAIGKPFDRIKPQVLSVRQKFKR